LRQHRSNSAVQLPQLERLLDILKHKIVLGSRSCLSRGHRRHLIAFSGQAILKKTSEHYIVINDQYATRCHISLLTDIVKAGVPERKARATPSAQRGTGPTV
jgi:hypothetical protein